MQRAQITKAGQMSVPASIRRRWETRTVTIEDRGDHFVVRPAPADPILAFRGSLQGRGPSSDEARGLAREEDRRREKQKAGSPSRKARPA